MSDQVIMWAKQEEAQRTQALEAKQTESQMRQVSQADIVDPFTHPKDVQHMARGMASVAGWTIPVQSAEAKDKQYTT